MLKNFLSFFVSKKNYKKGSIHQFKVKTLQNKDFDFSTLKGKKVMVVNTASKCGLTYQYEKLQKLYEKYKDHDFEIIGFPANNFLWQEPGENNEIEEFCQLNYGVTFPMMEKISVRGRKKHEVYKFLTNIKENGVSDESIKWNFQKYLINENGEIDLVISPRTEPDNYEIIDWIENKKNHFK